LIIQEGSKPLCDVPIVRIKKATEDSTNRHLLLLNVCAKLTVDVGNESVTHIRQPRLLCSDVRVLKRSKANAPCIDDELLAPSDVQIAEKHQAVRATIAHVCDNFLRGANNRGSKLRARSGAHNLFSSLESVQTDTAAFETRGAASAANLDESRSG
jgi:hypothetical protein